MSNFARRKLADEVPADWQVVKVDRWEAFRKKPVRIQGLGLMGSVGAAWFDQMVLGQAERDLPKKAVHRGLPGSEGVHTPLHEPCRSRREEAHSTSEAAS